MEYVRLNKLLQIEWNQIRTQASMLREDELLNELKLSSFERQDLLKKEGFSLTERWGSSFENKTITVYTVYPETEKKVWRFESEKEWHEISKERYGRYQVSGMNLARLDTAYKTALESKGITLPYVLAIRDTLNTIKEKAPSDADLNQFPLSLDDMRLGIDGNDYLITRFKDSFLVMFRQNRNLLIASFGIAILACVILIYLLSTVFKQLKIAEEKEKFSEGIVHDLRNPVAFIKSVLSDIKDGESSQQYVTDIEYENERISMMIENLLCVSASKQKQYIRKETVPLYEIIDNIVNRYKNSNKSLKISFKCDDASITADIDTFHIENAVMNLIENAIKYSNDKPEIFVGCERKDSLVHISVRDHGIGIPAKYMRRIFRKYFRVPKKDSIERTGFGLGLFYVKTVAEKHGGAISVKSEYNKGSEFTITIPK